MRQKTKVRITFLFVILCLISSHSVYTTATRLKTSDIYSHQNVLTFQQVWSNQKAEISRPNVRIRSA